jgi:hypothetical protein
MYVSMKSIAFTTFLVGASAPTPGCSSAPLSVGNEASGDVPDAGGEGDNPAANGRFDVNDVSILLPFPQTAADAALLPTLAGLLSASDTAMMNTATSGVGETGGGVGSPDPSAWQVIAMRFDPCALSTASSTTCHVEFRLVAEPVFPEFADAGIHLTYELAAADAASVVADLAALKALDPAHPTEGVALGVHPAIAATGLSGPTAAAFRALVAKYATPAALRDVAIFANTGVAVWDFAKATFDGGVLARDPIPFVTGDAISFIMGPPAGPDPVPTGPDNINVIADSVSPSASFFALSATAQQSAVNSAVRVENPLIHRLGDNDCVGCHQASRALERVAAIEGAPFTQSLATNPNAYIAPTTVTGSFSDPDPGDIANLHAFGYLNALVSIADYTVNDSARVAAYMNANFPASP